VAAGVADIAAVPAAVETVTAPPVPGLQKPLRWVGKRFRDRFLAAAVQTTPAWTRRSHLGACPAVGRDGTDCKARCPQLCRPLGG
jgi:hypothetical protein